ncbi:hypothetical protein [Duganella sp. BJB488]|uniref:hypothetical protein n=1 Tax=Duganella sp. BJB488 TaxID=1871350 RepID=UPI0013144E0D|nr:hypothetical protein [Duganella sp. BJB488]
MGTFFRKSTVERKARRADHINKWKLKFHFDNTKAAIGRISVNADPAVRLSLPRMVDELS